MDPKFLDRQAFASTVLLNFHLHILDNFYLGKTSWFEFQGDDSKHLECLKKTEGFYAINLIIILHTCSSRSYLQFYS